MDDPTKEQYRQAYTELANFCFNRLANVEARFVLLCERAKAVGIDCSDLMAADSPAVSDQASPAVRLVN